MKKNIHKENQAAFQIIVILLSQVLFAGCSNTPIQQNVPQQPPPVILMSDPTPGNVGDNNRMIRDNGVRVAYYQTVPNIPPGDDRSICWFFECRPSFLLNSGGLNIKIQLFQGANNTCNLNLNEVVRIRLTDVARNVEVLNAPNNLTVQNFATAKEFSTNQIVSSNPLYEIEVSIIRNGTNKIETASSHIVINNTFNTQKNLIVQHFRQQWQWGNLGSTEDGIAYSNQANYNFESKFQDCNINIQRGIDGIITNPANPNSDGAWTSAQLRQKAIELERNGGGGEIPLILFHLLFL